MYMDLLLLPLKLLSLLLHNKISDFPVKNHPYKSNFNVFNLADFKFSSTHQMLNMEIGSSLGTRSKSD